MKYRIKAGNVDYAVYLKLDAPRVFASGHVSMPFAWTEKKEAQIFTDKRDALAYLAMVKAYCSPPDDMKLVRIIEL